MIYARHPDARSRVTTAFITSTFAGGAVGSAGASALYGVGGWTAVCVLGATIAVLGAVTWALARRLGVASAQAPLRPA